MLRVKGVARGGPGVPVTPLCKPFFKQTTYNIPWQKRHDNIVWPSVTPPLKNPGYAPESVELRPKPSSLKLFWLLQVPSPRTQHFLYFLLSWT